MTIRQLLEKRKDLRQYLFIRGFLVTDAECSVDGGFPFYDNFDMNKLGKYYFYTHKKTGFHYHSDNGKIYFILGHAYNPFTMQYKEDEILKRVADLANKKQWQEAVDELTGVFAIGFVENGSIAYMVDPSGMQSLCSGIINGKFYLTSHPQLVGDICSLQMSDMAKRLTEYKWYYRVMGPYLPGDMTPFDELKRVVPNVYYTKRISQNIYRIEHKRIYPIKEIKICKTESEYNTVIKKAADILKNNMELVSMKWNKPYISLTGGIDSNTTFAAANGLYDHFKAFSYLSANKETIDVDAAAKVAGRFNVEHIVYDVPNVDSEVPDCFEIRAIIDHNNGYIARGVDNEYRKRAYLIKNLDCDVEVKSWTSETIRAYWYKHFGRKKMPPLSPKLYRNLYKIFIANRSLAHEVDEIFAEYIKEYEYEKIPKCYPTADMHYNEVTWGSWGGLNISEMKIYSDITIIYNNRIFLDLLFRVPLEDRISDKHHLDMKKYLNKDLYDMNIRVVNMKETDTRAFLLNCIFTENMISIF